MKKIYSAFALASVLVLSGCETGGASTENPQITLKGAKNIEIALGERSIPEGGFTATDTKDGDLTNSVTRNHNIDFARTGTYQITYSVVDSDGNKGQAVRQVVIKNTNGQGAYYDGGQQRVGSIPVITFPDGDPVYLALGESFDKTYTATDFEDGDLGAVVEITGAGFDASTPAGTYVVTYKVTDRDGNTVVKKRTVFVGYSNSNTDQTITNFATWYSNTCGKTFNRNLYNASTGAYNGNIECTNRGISSIDLTQVGIFSSIRSLDLSNNSLSDIDFTPLSSTRVIEKVKLSNNNLSYIDFSPLYTLKNINELWLNGNNLNYNQAEREAIYRGFNNRSFIVYF